MEGFKQNPKMKSEIACFKEGGSTTPAKREKKCDDKKDVAEDKKIVKKAVSQHEGAKHKGEEKTELKLKEGGRAKKKEGNVKRFDSKSIKMKKDESDKKAIAKIKKTKPVVERMSPAPKAPAPEGMGMPMEDTSDMNMGAYADGRQVNPLGQGMMTDTDRMLGGMEAYMPQQPGVPQPQNRGRMRPGMGQGAMSDSERVALQRQMLGGQGNMSDRERALLQGLQAVGNYCGGGKAY